MKQITLPKINFNFIKEKKLKKRIAKKLTVAYNLYFRTEKHEMCFD